MDFMNLTQEISEATHIGRSDIELIIRKAFTIISTQSQTNITIPESGTAQNINLLITKI